MIKCHVYIRKFNCTRRIENLRMCGWLNTGVKRMCARLDWRRHAIATEAELCRSTSFVTVAVSEMNTLSHWIIV